MGRSERYRQSVHRELAAGTLVQLDSRGRLRRRTAHGAGVLYRAMHHISEKRNRPIGGLAPAVPAVAPNGSKTADVGARTTNGRNAGSAPARRPNVPAVNVGRRFSHNRPYTVSALHSVGCYFQYHGTEGHITANTLHTNKPYTVDPAVRTVVSCDAGQEWSADSVDGLRGVMGLRDNIVWGS